MGCTPSRILTLFGPMVNGIDDSWISHSYTVCVVSVLYICACCLYYIFYICMQMIADSNDSALLYYITLIYCSTSKWIIWYSTFCSIVIYCNFMYNTLLRACSINQYYLKTKYEYFLWTIVKFSQNRYLRHNKIFYTRPVIV